MLLWLRKKIKEELFHIREWPIILFKGFLNCSLYLWNIYEAITWKQNIVKQFGKHEPKQTGPCSCCDATLQKNCFLLDAVIIIYFYVIRNSNLHNS